MRLPRGRPARRGSGNEAAAAYASARLPGSRTPWRSCAWCALDFELTGLDARVDEIISFGAIPIDDGRVVVGGSAYGLIRPERDLAEEAIRVHGIRASDLADAPPLAEAIGSILEAIAGRALVVHTAAVERTFLGRALREQGLRLRGPIVDTEVLGRLWLHECEGRLLHHVALGDLARSLGLPAERPHDALGDALTTAQVFIALASHLDAQHAETVGSLARAERRVDALRLFHGN